MWERYIRFLRDVKYTGKTEGGGTCWDPSSWCQNGQWTAPFTLERIYFQRILRDLDRFLGSVGRFSGLHCTTRDAFAGLVDGQVSSIYVRVFQAGHKSLPRNLELPETAVLVPRLRVVQALTMCKVELVSM
jgi:hypothetical protein